jgi:hypothetical protein
MSNEGGAHVRPPPGQVSGPPRSQEGGCRGVDGRAGRNSAHALRSRQACATSASANDANPARRPGAAVRVRETSRHRVGCARKTTAPVEKRASRLPDPWSPPQPHSERQKRRCAGFGAHSRGAVRTLGVKSALAPLLTPTVPLRRNPRPHRRSAPVPGGRAHEVDRRHCPWHAGATAVKQRPPRPAHHRRAPTRHRPSRRCSTAGVTACHPARPRPPPTPRTADRTPPRHPPLDVTG